MFSKLFLVNFFFLLLLSSVEAFVLRPTVIGQKKTTTTTTAAASWPYLLRMSTDPEQESTPTTTISSANAASTTTSTSSSSDFDINSILSSIKDFDLSSLTENADQLRANMMEGELGTRGEAYAIAQAACIFCILIGGIPVVGNTLNLLLGPGLLLAGLLVIVVGVQEMGGALSPWPQPTNQGLKTDGLFSQMRHPIYAGSLAACAGFSILTGSANRLLLTALLLYVLEVKTDYEEDELTKMYPDYAAYKAQVTNKFFPQAILDVMPWTSSSSKDE